MNCMIADRHSLSQRLARLAKTQEAQRAQLLAELEAAIARSQAKAQARRALAVAPTFAAELPIVARKDEIAAAIAAHQVVIVCGETGSGKTTQLPKICLELGRGIYGQIGCTQPRRIAARSVANRLAKELGGSLGQSVGYQVRFHDRVGPNSLIKVMTDGILLAETNGDRWLNAYDTLIIDEAHERSLNIDFLLGYVKRLLARRPELKLIITSATLDAQRFSQSFANAPVVEVSGRMYPVEVRYRDPAVFSSGDEPMELTVAVLHAVDELCSMTARGDVLVFLPGEREIRDCAEALRKHHPPHTQILPLFARLSLAEQERVFQPSGARRIVLATNVAETSLTVPGIRYVVDSGLGRINRYSPRRKVNQLQIERVSRAAATQRAGRCGRLENGVCIRLYSEEDFRARAEFTTPEILRTSLAAVILRMQALELGEVGAFPFVEAPSAKMIEAGYQLLHELGAVDSTRRVTALGRQLARIPVDPRIARTLLAGAERSSLTETLIIAAALSVQDPRERPMAKRNEALASHTQFHDERSDFLALLKLWAFFDDALKHKKSNRKLQQLCHDNFLSYLRLKEWRDVHTQLHALVTEMGMRCNASPATYEQVHRAVLTGLLGNIGCKDMESDVYRGARDSQFWISHDSGLGKRRPKWVMAAELVETARLYARVAAAIEPEWIESAAGDLVKRSYSDPHWERKSAQVVAYERVTLYGLPIVLKRRVHFGPIDPKTSREIFIKHALVAGEFDTRAQFLRHNLALIESIEEMEQKVRRQDILVDDTVRFAFYDAILPADIVNGAGFEKWRRGAEAQQPRLLSMQREQLIREGSSWAAEELFPNSIKVAAASFALSYVFNPGHVLDGVTVTLPVHMINRVSTTDFDWLVPGLLREKLTGLLKSLPQRLRRAFVPVKDTVTLCLERLQPTQALLPSLAALLSRLGNVAIVPGDFDPGSLAPYLQMNYRIVDAAGEELATGRDLAALQVQFANTAQAVLREEPEAYERDNIKRWDFGDLPAILDVVRGSTRMKAYPALVDRGDRVAIALFDAPASAEPAMRQGLVRLILLELAEQTRYLERNLPHLSQMCLRYAALAGAPGDPAAVPGGASATRGGTSATRMGALDVRGRSEEFKHHLLSLCVDQVFLVNRALPRSEAEFAARRDAGRAALVPEATRLAKLTHETLELHARAATRLQAREIEHWHHAVDDIQEQLAHLVYAGFLLRTPMEQLAQLPRYLTAILQRLDKLRVAPQRDQQATVEIARLWQNYRNLQKRRAQPDTETAAQIDTYRWMLEELRVSLFAQELKTAYPISVKRAVKQWELITATI